MVLADVGIAIILGRILLLSGQASVARQASLIWLYFPLGIIISSVWGQLDPVALFLSLLAVYYFLTSRTILSAIMLGLSIYLKTLPAIFLPVFLFQNSLIGNKKLSYSSIALAIPLFGTTIPAIALDWGFRGMYNNVSFQVDIPSNGAMSLLGQVRLIPSIQGPVQVFAGLIWIPATLIAYSYVWKNKTPLIQGLLFVVLTFSLSRPFLPEQWSLYPLALLLLTSVQGKLEHFLGLSVAATGFLVANNTLMVRFLSPISVAAFNWDITVNSHSPFLIVRTFASLFMITLYFTESAQVLLNRESIVYRILVLGSPLNRLMRPRISPLEAPVS